MRVHAIARHKGPQDARIHTLAHTLLQTHTRIRTHTYSFTHTLTRILRLEMRRSCEVFFSLKRATASE